MRCHRGPRVVPLHEDETVRITGRFCIPVCIKPISLDSLGMFRLLSCLQQGLLWWRKFLGTDRSSRCHCERTSKGIWYEEEKAESLVSCCLCKLSLMAVIHWQRTGFACHYCRRSNHSLEKWQNNLLIVMSLLQTGIILFITTTIYILLKLHQTNFWFITFS